MSAKKQTAVEQIIKLVKAKKEMLFDMCQTVRLNGGDTLDIDTAYVSIQILLKDIEAIKPIEREQIIRAVEHGYLEMNNSGQYGVGQIYYSQTFGTQSDGIL